MKRNGLLRVAILVAAMALALAVEGTADDGAASIAAGGLVPRRETRIAMAREVLRIGRNKVAVDYDFRNDAAQDVTTEVAFPIPPYASGFVEGPAPAEQSFQSFRLWVDGQPVAYETEATATLNGKDVTALLKANQIDIPTFGHFVDKLDAHRQEVIDSPDFTRLPKPARDRLVAAGIFKLYPAPGGEWTVHLQYHWTQTFPAHSTVHIRHEYTPVVGAEDSVAVEALQLALDSGSARKDASRWSGSGAEEVLSFCPEPDLLRGMIHRASEASNNADAGGGFPVQWVDFILTTANTWQRPIEDFTLIVERPQPGGGWRPLVSFCSPANGKVEKLDGDHFQVHLSNFVPTSELHIGFFLLPAAKPGPATGRK